MASFLNELKSVASRGPNLRQVAESDRKDRSSANLSLPGKDVLDDEEERWKLYFDSGMSGWYNLISSRTFSTTFCDISPEEAKIIVCHWDDQMKMEKEKNDNNDSTTRPTTTTTTSESCHEYSEQLLNDVKVNLRELCIRLDKAIKVETEKSSVGLAFVKLSTRSPKDSRRVLRRAAEVYKDRVKQQKEKDKTPLDSNRKWQILSEEVARASAIKDGESALDILLGSFRVYEDLKYALNGPTTTPWDSSGKVSTASDNSGTVGRKWNVSLVARAWDPRLTLDTEFRGICWDGKLTCLCQYFHPLFFPNLLETKNEIQEDILKCFAEPCIQEAVQNLGGNCIIDFARLGPGETIIIELNPFDGVCLGTFPASTGLFLWDDPVDQQIMRGVAPFEFRIRESPMPEHKLKVDFHPDWASIIYDRNI